MRMVWKGLLLLGLVIVFLVQAGEVCWSQTTELISVDSTGDQGNSASNCPSISADGRFVAFESFATNLVTGDTNTRADVFVHDRQTETTTRVSLHTDGTEGDHDSGDPSISADGRFVAFESLAGSLVAGDMAFPMGFPDIFVRDRDADENGTYDETGGVSTVRVSVDSGGNEGIGESLAPAISGDGRYVAFQSNADLVVADTNGFPDIFVHDRDADDNGIYDEVGAISTIRVSVRSDGTEADEASSAPSISPDGRFVAFESFATNLVANDTNGRVDVFVHDRDADGNGTYDETGGISTVRVSIDSAGSEANSDSNSPSISADGRYVVFESDANNLVSIDTNGSLDIFVRDMQAGTTMRVSVHSNGDEANDNSRSSFISSDGRYVTFHSDADNLVADDNNSTTDIFIRDLQAGTTMRVSLDSNGTEGNGPSRYPSISSGSIYIAFESDANNLVDSDTNGFFDVFFQEWQKSNTGGNGNIGCFISTAAAYGSGKETPPSK